MKWLKHETDAANSEKLEALIDKHGFEGYGRYWRIMEIVAERMDNSDRYHAEYPENFWLKQLKIRRPLLLQFLADIELLFDIKVIRSNLQADNRQVTNRLLIRIEIPNLLKKRDYATLKKRQRQNWSSLEEEEEVEVEVEVETHISQPKKTTDRKKDKEKYDSVDFKFAEQMTKDIGSWSGSFKIPSIGPWAEEIKKMRQVDEVSIIDIKSTWDAIQRDSPVYHQGTNWKGWRSVILTAKKYREMYHQVRVKLNLDNFLNTTPSPYGTIKFVGA
jgi:hypothetical protein